MGKHAQIPTAVVPFHGLKRLELVVGITCALVICPRAYGQLFAIEPKDSVMLSTIGITVDTFDSSDTNFGTGGIYATNFSPTIGNMCGSNVAVYPFAATNFHHSTTSSVSSLIGSQSQPPLLISLISPTGGSSTQFQISGVAGYNYAVEGSTNLANWISLITNSGPFLFSDPNAGAFPNRNYRVRWVPQ